MAKRLTPLANTEYRHVTTANSANESSIRLSSALFAPAQFLHLSAKVWSHLQLFGKFSWAKSIDFNPIPYNRETCDGERFPHIDFEMVSERLETESCLVRK